MERMIDPCHSILVVYKKHTWSVLQISRADMEYVLEQYGAFVSIVEIFRTFGVEVQERVDPENFFRTVRPCPSPSRNKLYEICYKFVYVAENGRSRGSPWSLRQTGLYQQVSIKTGRSRFLLLHPAEEVVNIIQTHISNPMAAKSCPVQFHAMIVQFMVGRWDRYLQHIYQKISDLDEKACFSKVDHTPKGGFQVSFSDCQNLQIHRQRLLQASIVLDHYIDLISRLADESEFLESAFPDDDYRRLAVEFESYKSRIRCLKKFNKMILRQSEGTRILLTKAVESRNSALLQEATLTMQSHLAFINQSSYGTQNEITSMLAITKQTIKASKTVKFLTLTTTIYLPATLMATVFSSNLVQLSGEDSPSQSASQRHYVLHSQFYLYILTTLVLTMVTAGAIWLHDKGVRSVRQLLGLDHLFR
ncbi:hypothetical protein BDW69DRAFT_165851 [Aspergillus filifer]